VSRGGYNTARIARIIYTAIHNIAGQDMRHLSALERRVPMEANLQKSRRFGIPFRERARARARTLAFFNAANERGEPLTIFVHLRVGVHFHRRRLTRPQVFRESLLGD